MNFHSHINYPEMNPDELAGIIKDKYHTSAKQKLQFILNHLQESVKVDSTIYQSLDDIFLIFKKLKEDLEAHFRKEELILFPYICQMMEMIANAKTVAGLQLPLIATPIDRLKKEHDNFCTALNEIRLLSHNYISPSNASMHLKLSLAELMEFERDLHIHIYIENNVLFPKLIAMEQKSRDKKTRSPRVNKPGKSLI